MTPNLVLAGFMGTGKSTVGQLAADRLEMAFLDTDQLIEALTGRTIPELFAQSEAIFRKYESIVCLQSSLLDGAVISVGGGALINEKARTALEASGLVICLTATLDTVMQRVGGSRSRPLIGTREEVGALLEARTPHYESFRYRVATDGRTPYQVLDEVMELWQYVS